MACKYTKAYIGNLEYVSDGLLNIINTIILPDNTNNTPISVTLSSGNCNSALPTDNVVVFNCAKWAAIEKKLINRSEDETNVPPGLLVTLNQNLKCILNTTTGINHGFAAQIERFICLIESLETRIDSIACNSRCLDVVGDLLCLIIQIITQLISIISKLSVLVYYINCDITSSTGDKIIASFFDCMVCDFINDLCRLENLIPELSSIVINFATCDSKSCTPCYTASCSPRKIRPICPNNIPSGCSSCKCNKSCNCGCNR